MAENILLQWNINIYLYAWMDERTSSWSNDTTTTTRVSHMMRTVTAPMYMLARWASYASLSFYPSDMDTKTYLLWLIRISFRWYSPDWHHCHSGVVQSCSQERRYKDPSTIGCTAMSHSAPRSSWWDIWSSQSMPTITQYCHHERYEVSTRLLFVGVVPRPQVQKTIHPEQWGINTHRYTMK